MKKYQVEEREAIKAILDFYTDTEEDILKIRDLVINNPKFFHLEYGTRNNALRAACKTLVRLVKNHKIYLDKNPYAE